MLKGKHLNKNSNLGIIAPASCDEKIIINNNIDAFKKLNFKIKTSHHLYDKYGYLAGKDLDRANDLNNMFADDSIDGIICLRGGYGSINTIPYLDIKCIKNNPKFFCGYSDITILLNYLSSLGLITFHGPMVNSNFNDKITLESFISISTSNTFTYNLSNYKNIEIINPKSFSGKMSGGNLSVICSSLGTPYEINTDNSILLIEEINEYPYAIDRMLSQLILSEKFKSCNGIILGHFKNCSLNNYTKSFTLKEIFINKLSTLGIPIIINFPFGHDYPNLTLPIGVIGKFSYKNMTLSFDNFLL